MLGRIWRFFFGQGPVAYQPDDDAMNRAIAAAQATLGHCLERLADPAFSSDTVTLKVAVWDDQHDVTEHMHVTGIEVLDDGWLRGTLRDQPVEIADLQAGDGVTFTREDVSDWSYEEDGLIHGAYTFRVMLDQLSDREAEGYRSRLAPLPASGGTPAA